MFTIPIELLTDILENITNIKDQVQCQLVCRNWHIHAKSNCYKTVTFQYRVNELTQQPEGSFQLLNFIRCMSESAVGEYVKNIRIDFKFGLEARFMPTKLDIQYLARACPNLESLLFPTNMFWNDIATVDATRYWKKLKRLPSLRIQYATEIPKLRQFSASLTYLEMEEFTVDDDLAGLISSCPKLETLKITTKHSFTNLNEVIPILIGSSSITQLVMTRYKEATVFKTKAVLSNLRSLVIHLLDNHNISMTIHSILYSFPNLSRLVLRLPANVHWSDGVKDGMMHLIRFMTSLPNAMLSLFAPNNSYLMMHDLVLRHFLHMNNRIKLKIAYDSRTSLLTKTPDLTYRNGELYVLYQGPLSAPMMPHHLPHMMLLKEYGVHIQEELVIHAPLSLLTKAQEGLCDNNTTIESILVHHCPKLIKKLHLNHHHFHLLPNVKVVQLPTYYQLNCLVLENSVISDDSLFQFSKQFQQLQYLELNLCKFAGNNEGRVIYMPFTKFKKLKIIATAQNGYVHQKQQFQITDNDKTISLFAQRCNQTNTFQYTNTSNKLTKVATQDGCRTPLKGSNEDDLFVHCHSIESFQFNNTHLYNNALLI